MHWLVYVVYTSFFSARMGLLHALVDQQPVHCLEKTVTVHSQADSNSTSEEVPNKETDCAAVGAVVDPCHTLLKYQHEPTACRSNYS